MCATNRRGFLASSAAAGAASLIPAAARAVTQDDAIRPFHVDVPEDALVDLREMRHHSFDERLRKLAHARLGRAKFPEIVDLLRSFATLEIAPEMILNCRFAGAATFTHGPPAV